MLYDQALLAMAYVEAHQVTGKERYAQVAREILKYVLRDMTSPEGAFYSAEDADSEGKEGTFYVWKPSEVKEILGEKVGALLCRYYGIREEGNFEEGMSIPHVTVAPESFAKREGMGLEEWRETLERGRETLFSAREKRIHPLKDDKILASWNGLMIAALCKADRALGEPRYGEAAGRAAQFVLSRMVDEGGRLLRRYRDGEPAYAGYLEDYAFLVWGLLELYETRFDLRHLEKGLTLSRAMMDLFWDDGGGGFFFSGEGNETLIARAKEAHDGALPSGNSVAATNLFRLGRMTGDVSLEKRAEELLHGFAAQVAAVPMAHTHLLMALDFRLGPSREIVVAGDRGAMGTRAMLEAVQTPFLPHTVLLLKEEGRAGERLAALAPFTQSLTARDGTPTAYVCENFACRQPETNLEALKKSLGP
jgi:uncharacterized protein YyaL (SSP411 family)